MPNYAEQVDKLIEFCEAMIKASRKERTPNFDYYIADDRTLQIWLTNCKALVQMLGVRGQPWQGAFIESHPNVNIIRKQLGALEGIKYAIQNGLLFEIEDFVRAELFDDLLSQADYLLSEGFHVPAAVMARSVLEEHLKKKCSKASCNPTKTRPMLGDYISALEMAKVFNAIAITSFRLMNKVGSAAAHGEAVDKVDVEKMLRDVRDALIRYPI